MYTMNGAYVMTRALVKCKTLSPFSSSVRFYRTRVRSLGILVSNSLTHSFSVNLIDGTLACEDANLKLVEVVTVADVDAEDNVGNSLLQIWELTFGSKAKLLFRL